MHVGKNHWRLQEIVGRGVRSRKSKIDKIFTVRLKAEEFLRYQLDTRLFVDYGQPVTG